ncbi:MAG: MurR/RpiR family transcriptional regulator [Bifidobacteriaceae bacterium]|jgi:DNA-binding MurR/RpiR family transcriptional regulator|nr:MurR/RpiR family transcriptional regulator [Bifidobacteriaceae bacterium]
MNEDVIARIQRMVSSRKLAEARIAVALLDNLDGALTATASELAETAGVSQASVIRFSQEVGYKGLPELRIDLAQELSRRALELEQANVAEGGINLTDSMAEIIVKLAFHESLSINQTARRIDVDAVERVARAVAASDRQATVGVGASGLAAHDLAQKLQRIGLNCFYSMDSHLQLSLACLSTPKSVVVGFSFAGQTLETHQALALARGRGALTVAVTGDAGSPVAKVADEVLAVSVRESPFRVGALASRMAQLAIVDFLFVRVAQLCEAQVREAVESSKDAVRPLKLGSAGRAEA